MLCRVCWGCACTRHNIFVSMAWLRVHKPMMLLSNRLQHQTCDLGKVHCSLTYLW